MPLGSSFSMLSATTESSRHTGSAPARALTKTGRVTCRLSSGTPWLSATHSLVLVILGCALCAAACSGRSESSDGSPGGSNGGTAENEADGGVEATSNGPVTTASDSGGSSSVGGSPSGGASTTPAGGQSSTGGSAGSGGGGGAAGNVAGVGGANDVPDACDLPMAEASGCDDTGSVWVRDVVTGVCCEYAICAVPLSVEEDAIFETEADCNPHGCGCVTSSEGVVANPLGCFCEPEECPTLQETVEAECVDGAFRLVQFGCGAIEIVQQGIAFQLLRKFDSETGQLLGHSNGIDNPFGACNAWVYEFGDTTECETSELCDLCGVSAEYPPCPIPS